MNGYCHAMNNCNSVVDIMAVLQNIYGIATILYQFLEEGFWVRHVKKNQVLTGLSIFFKCTSTSLFTDSTKKN